MFDEYRDGKVFSSTWDLFERGVDNMLARDGKARALEQVLILPMRGAPHSIDPAQGDSGEAEWVRETLERPANNGGMSTPLDSRDRPACSAVVYRRAFFEKVWRSTTPGTRSASTSWRSAPPPPAGSSATRRPVRSRGSASRSTDDKGATEWVDIPALKAFVFIHGQHRNPLNGIS
jgi:hypothetical protein